jgi:hypothetical protein
MSKNEADDDHINEIIENPMDVIESSRFVTIYIALYVLRWVISGVNPLWGALTITVLTAILEGKRSREDLAEYYVNEPVPVSVQISGLELQNTRYIDNVTIPWKFYTTDVHRIIPQFVVEWYKSLHDTIILSAQRCCDKLERK